MAVETATNISQLNPLWPQDIDQEAEGAGHIRVTKLAIIDTFPNVTATVNPTAVEFNRLVGVTGDIQTQLNLKAPLASPALTGTPTAPTAAPLSTGTQIATLDYVQGELTNGYAKLASPHFTGVPTAPTASPGSAGTQLATLDYANALAFSAALPAQTGNAGKQLETNGTVASWGSSALLKAGDSMSGGFNEIKGADIASAATLSGIWTAAEGNTQTITGTTNTTSLGTAPQAGAKRTLLAAGNWPLVNGANLILPGAANYTCVAGDRLEVLAVTTTQHRVSIYKQDGTSVISVPGGTVCLATATVVSGTPVATVDFTGIDSTYDEYEVHYINATPATNAVRFGLRYSNDGGATFLNSTYAYSSNGRNSANADASDGATNGGQVPLTNADVNSTATLGGVSGVLRLFNPSGTAANKHCTWASTYGATASSPVSTGGGAQQTANQLAVNAVRLLFSSGNIASGIFKLYGVRKTV